MTASAKDRVLPAARAAIYVRLSKEDVSGKRLGIESTAVQLHDAREAVAREGWTVDEAHVFVDDGLSGTKMSRPAWQAMLSAAKRREFSMVVVRDLDRFSRIDPVRALGIIRDLEEVGVALWSYRERQYISVDGDHVVVTAMRARQAAAEAEKASERITAGLRARAREGRATGKAPFGYRTRTVTEQDVRDSRDPSLRPGKWYEKYEPEVAVLRHVYALMCKHESYTGTIGELNAEGARPPKSQTWRPATLKMLLTHTLPRGFRLYKGERVDRPELRIFTTKEVERIDAILKKTGENRPWSSRPRKSGTFNLAVGFVACGVCGGTVVASGSHNRSYVCDRHRLKMQCRGIGYRSADRVDEAVVRAVDATLTPETIAAVCAVVREQIEARPKARENDRERIVHEVATTEERIRNLTDAVAKAPAALHGPLYERLGDEMTRLSALRAGVDRLDGAPAELDARRTVAKVEKRARELRAMLLKGGREAADAIRVVLGGMRLEAHLVTVEGKRGWKLSGRIGGFYVFDDVHHGSDSMQKLAIKGDVTGVIVTPVTNTGPSPSPTAAPAEPAPAATPAAAAPVPPPPAAH